MLFQFSLLWHSAHFLTSLKPCLGSFFCWRSSCTFLVEVLRPYITFCSDVITSICDLFSSIPFLNKTPPPRHRADTTMLHGLILFSCMDHTNSPGFVSSEQRRLLQNAGGHLHGPRVSPSVWCRTLFIQTLVLDD